LSQKARLKKRCHEHQDGGRALFGSKHAFNIAEYSSAVGAAAVRYERR
jgi:hypothetical protein